MSDNSTLKLNDEGEEVLEVQKQLGQRGYVVQADGKFGKISESALKQFQRNSGLAATGHVDQATREALSLK